MGRRSKAVELDHEVHGLLVLGKTMYQHHLAKKNGRPATLTMNDYLHAIAHDMDPEAIAAMRVASQLHHLQPGEHEAYVDQIRGPRK